MSSLPACGAPRLSPGGSWTCETPFPLSQVGLLGSHSWANAGPSRLRAAFEVTPGPGWGQQCRCTKLAVCGPGRHRCQCGNSALLPTHPYIMPVVILTTDTSSASEDEGSLRRPGRLTSTPLQSHSNIEPWLDRVIQGSSTSSSASSTSSHPGGRPAAAPSAAATTLTGPAAHAHIGQ